VHALPQPLEQFGIAAENFAQHGTITLRAFGIIPTRSGNGIVSDSPSAPTGIDRSQPTIRSVARPVLI
jgi:hypothetical protein